MKVIVWFVTQYLYRYAFSLLRNQRATVILYTAYLYLSAYSILDFWLFARWVLRARIDVVFSMIA